MAEYTNPYIVKVVNPLEALMAGEQGYKESRNSRKETDVASAREQAAQAMLQGGDTKSAIARLMSVGDIQGASTIANMGNNERDFAFRQQESQRAQGNADRGFGLQERQIAATAGNTSASRELARAQFEYQRSHGDRQFGQTSQYQAAQMENMQEQRRLQERALEQKGEALEGQIEQRKRAAILQGIDPSSPAFQSFVLTGKMPREDQQPLSATDKKAILEADEGVMAGQAAIEALQKAKTLSPKAYTGPTASMRGYATSLVGSEAGEATAELENVVTANALTQMKAIFGGNPTEGERQILLDIQGSSKLSDAVRQKIFDRAMIAANRRLDFNKQRAAAMRGGTFYKPVGQSAAPSMNPTGPGNTVTGVGVTDMPPPPSGFQLVK